MSHQEHLFIEYMPTVFASPKSPVMVKIIARENSQKKVKYSITIIAVDTTEATCTSTAVAGPCSGMCASPTIFTRRCLTDT